MGVLMANVSGRKLVKLVRDRVADNVAPPVIAVYGPMDDRSRHVEELRKKLGEEAIEYILDPSLAELADVLEVVKALAEIDLGVDLFAVEREAADKYAARGGFEVGTGLFVEYELAGPPDGYVADRA